MTRLFDLHFNQEEGVKVEFSLIGEKYSATFYPTDSIVSDVPQGCHVYYLLGDKEPTHITQSPFPFVTFGMVVTEEPIPIHLETRMDWVTPT